MHAGYSYNIQTFDIYTPNYPSCYGDIIVSEYFYINFINPYNVE